MHLRYTAALLVGCPVFGIAVAGALQVTGVNSIGDAAPPRAAHHAKPTNLKVLPKDISPEDLDKLMHGFQKELGVPCGYCHEENQETQDIDFASDANPVKETARFMISMTSDINNKYLAQLGDRQFSEPIGCGNCHRGQIDPPSFEPKSSVSAGH